MADPTQDTGGEAQQQEQSPDALDVAQDTFDTAKDVDELTHHEISEKLGLRKKEEPEGEGQEGGEQAEQPASGETSLKPEGPETPAGENAVNPAEKVADQGAKGAGKAGAGVAEDAVADAGADVAADAALEGGALLGAEAGLEAGALATAPESLGASLAVPVAIEGAKAGWKYKWWVIAVIICLLLGGLIMAYYFISKFFSFDKSSPVANSAVSSIESSVGSGKIVFDSANDLAKIKNADIGENPLKMMDYLSQKHESIEIHFSGLVAPGATITQENDQSAFDVTAADNIKCTDTSTNAKIIEFPINLNTKFDWKSKVLSNYSDKIRCAVGYYPKIDSPVSGKFSSTYGPGEFSVLELEKFAPMAAQEKTAEITDEILGANDDLGIDKNGDNNLLPTNVVLNPLYIKTNLSKTGSGVIDTLKSTIQKVYENQPGQGVIPSTADDGIGLKVKFL
ncbi:MAG: hypothetical protein NTZ65_03035 [Candidatus Berkelbacteria bacterium]|nr:hypothetical protein [Candidatus Berkelbacteria bacterium]